MAKTFSINMKIKLFEEYNTHRQITNEILFSKMII